MKKRAARPASPTTVVAAKGSGDEPLMVKTIPIVGVGASAGGLEAFTELLAHLPLDTGMGFVLVQHLDPQHPSALTQLLGRATALPVLEAENAQRVEPNKVYVIPPNTNLGIAAGVLQLVPRAATRTPHRSIDFFFEALAADQGDRAIGVVLSGTATDGTLGLEAIKAEGGITFAQDESAKYDSMPRSAVAAGCVDFVLSPEHIASELRRIAAHPAVASLAPRPATPVEADRGSEITHEDDGTPLPSGGRGTPQTGATRARIEADGGGQANAEVKLTQEGFKQILLLLRNHAGVDFSLYKSSTVQRRIVRRMVLNRHATLQDYARSLQRDSKELDSLYSDTLISVTSFFRNPETFDVLLTRVWPTLLRQRGDDPLRVWVLGCSTGQEAYSIVMTFVEAAEKAPRMRKLQVFATDLNDALLEKARTGLYARTLAQDISPNRLQRFFVEEDGGYRVRKPLREMVVFARQNLIGDPPFSRMDLISCRNLLIYFEPDLQKTVIPVFHFALKPGGFLCLGASESIGGFTELFEPVDKKHKIYSKKATATPSFRLPPRVKRGESPPPASRPAPKTVQQQSRQDGAVEEIRTELSAQREADRVTVTKFAPPSVLISGDLQILQFRGSTGAYLTPPAGKATLDVLKMARPGLMLPLRAVINKARKSTSAARKEQVRVEQDGTIRTVNLEVIPLKNLRESCFLIVFEEAKASGGRKAVAAPPTRAAESRRIAELEREIADIREYLQSVQEQHEAANEELQASNEEVQSANEELQSVNEELEASKEELESTNEELTTVNDEMVHRNAELNRLNNDLINIQTSAQVAIVLLGRDLSIRRFSLHAEKLLTLTAADLGRPVGHIRHNFALTDLEALVTDVIDTLIPRELEVQDKEGRWFSLHARPYLTLDNQVDGAVLVLMDISIVKRSEQAAHESEARSRAMFESTSVGVSETDSATGRFLRVNGRFERMLGYTTAMLEHRTFSDLTHPEDHEVDYEDSARLVRGQISSYECEKRLVRSDGKLIWIHLTANLVRGASNEPLRTVTISLDITARKEAEEALRQSHAELQVHAAELTRFNRVAVERELRMIELKKEVNRLSLMLGDSPRYPLEFDHEQKDTDG